MPISEPAWWYRSDPTLLASLLSPAAGIWAWMAERRLAQARPYRSGLPVICIGNLTAGGTGKTPLALFMAGLLRGLGRSPAFLTRGYGGSRSGPHLVVAGRDGSAEVGDEPLLLAAAAPVMVARDRAAGARAIEALAPRPDVIVMDDGLQNPGLAKDVSLAVVDGRRGVGNGRVIPAGPLRAPLAAQLGRLDAIVVNRPAGANEAALAIADRLRGGFGGPVLMATTRPVGDLSWLAGRPVIAFAGIGAPRRFFDLLAALGASVLAAETFPDHHRLGEAEAERLLALARSRGAALVTTEKDRARLDGGSPAITALRGAVKTLGIALSFEPGDLACLTALLEGRLAP